MSEPRVEMYTTQYCGYCINAKRVLQRDGIDYVDHDVGRDPQLRQKIARETGWRTVPMIFVDGKFVGGYTEMMAFRSKGGFETQDA